jgi:exopolysaccharide production protein ExoQ
MRIPAKFLQDAVTVLILFMTTGAFESLVVDGSDPQAATNGSPVMWLVWLVLYIFIGLRLVPKYREAVALVRANRFLFLLVALTILSTVWSVDPGLTFRRSIALLATSLVGIDFAVRYSIREQLRLLSVTFSVFVILSIVAQVFFSGFIPYMDFGEEAWHGILSNKNSWAKLIVLATIAMLCHSRRTRWHSLLAGGLLAGAVVLVLAANSKGALIVLATMLLFIKISGALRWNTKRLTIATVVLVIVAAPSAYLILHNLGSVTEMLGRDATLTGRAILWQLSLASIERSPLYGYGYSAFWSASSQEAMRIRGEMNWDAPHAHNGYIDITLAMGAAGLFLYFIGYVVVVRRAVARFREDCGQEAIWPLAFLVFIFLSQLTESGILAANSIFWVLYITAACSVTELTPTFAATPMRESQSDSSRGQLDILEDFA